MSMKGLLTVAPVSYLVAISGRQQIAQIRGSPIYVITDVALIPLSSQAEAKRAILQARKSLKESSGDQRAAAGASDSDTPDEEEEHVGSQNHVENDQVSPVSTESHTEEAAPGQRPAAPARSTSNVAEDVIGRKGQYGRFAERWFSKKGWTTEKRRAQGMSTDESQKLASTTDQAMGIENLQSEHGSAENTFGEADAIAREPESREGQGGQGDQPVTSSADVTNTLLPKLLRTTRILLASRSFFFSYDLDITRRLGTHPSKNIELPLHKTVDPLFFWNQHLASSFIDGGHHSFVLPVMQGFVGQRAFKVDKKSNDSVKAVPLADEGTKDFIDAQQKAETEDSGSSFLITLISRRSIKRPGLRYLRRGVDDEGHTANSVETEQILSKVSWAPSEKVYSFTQVRGSIPLFFSQSPYSFKPVPVLQHSAQTNYAAFKRHFTNITSRYGGVQIVLLVDKTGGEAEIGQRYEENTKAFNEDNERDPTQLGFEWFDFHNICRGMKFENVSLLMDSIGGILDEFGKTVIVDGIVKIKQTGVLRTNCMDCLDRTNVVQSACGQRALEEQLNAEGVDVDLRTDVKTQWFNTLWADNGDAISKQYSSTAALKGDYTRTRRRNYRGAINDLGLTLSRYYNNIVNDYFSQAAIDYLLGNVTSQVFEDFEDRMMTGDPGMSMRKVRENAISTSSKIVIEDSSEDLIGGWTLLSPREANTVRTFPLEEVVLLVTDAALYKVCFDWNNEKVSSFEKVDLRSLTGIMKGIYITSTLTSAQTDEQRNVGFVVKYRPGKEDIARVNTRSLSSAVGLDGSTTKDPEGTDGQKSQNDGPSALRILSFKALPARSSFASDGQETHTMSEKEFVNNICDEIRRAALDGGSGATDFVENNNIITLQEARKSTGFVEQWGHSLKRMVWG